MEGEEKTRQSSPVKASAKLSSSSLVQKDYIITNNMLQILRRGISHIKNMLEENIKHKINELEHAAPMVQARVYKPSKTIEFNREGEKLLYDCDPIKYQTIYLRYPYVMYETFIPLSIINYFYNPLDLNWFYNSGAIMLACFIWYPRYACFQNFQYLVRRLYLLRGGRVMKIQTNTLYGTPRTFWINNYEAKPLTADAKHFQSIEEGDFLQEEGQLKHQLKVQMDNLMYFSVNVQDQIFTFKKQGKVIEPELFEATLKGFNIDTSDFTINTADNERFFEGKHNM